MKILVVTQWFWPEDFRINDICEALKDEGHEIEILTGLPNYPNGKIFEGYSIFNKGAKEYKGMKIMRVPLIPRGKNNFIMLALNYVSFMVTASVKALMLFKKYDRVFVFQISPITSAIPAIIISKIKKIPSYIYVQDLWPETFYSIVNVKNNIARRMMKTICNKIYKFFDKLLLSSKGYEDIFIKEGFQKEKLEYFPQWAEDFYSNSNEEYIKHNKDFIVTFAGNVGKAQSIETIIKAANLAKRYKDIKWRIIGDGSEFENIKKMLKYYSLEETVELLGRKSSEEMPYYFLQSDALIVTLKNDYILNITLPGKIQSYMAIGKPILAAISGEGKKVIEESDSGLVTEAEDFEGLFKNVIKLKKMDKDEQNILGINGKKYFEKNFKRSYLLKRLKKILELKNIN